MTEMLQRMSQRMLSQPRLSGWPRKWSVAAEPGARSHGGGWIRRTLIPEKWKVTMCFRGNENSDSNLHHQGKKMGRWSDRSPGTGTERKLSFEGWSGRVRSEGQKRQLHSTSAGEGRRWEPTKVAS